MTSKLRNETDIFLRHEKKNDGKHFFCELIKDIEENEIKFAPFDENLNKGLKCKKVEFDK